MNTDYFLNSGTSEQWQKIVVKKRAGVVVPLFSVWSNNSSIGEFTDLNGLVDWCNLCGLSIIQLLPLNEMGSDNSPYNSISSFGLEPAYLNLRELYEVDLNSKHKNKISNLYSSKKKTSRVDYRIKSKKLKLLREIFLNVEPSLQFNEFVEANRFWLECFALFKLLKSLNEGKCWSDWDDKFKDVNSDSVNELKIIYEKELNFIKWVQWQAFIQLTDAKKYAGQNNVILMGDLPYLVSPDSADVWQNQNYFQLGKVVGAPPDMYMSKGQRWGMHPYNWMNIAVDGFDYIKEKLGYASNFYHSYRIDHFIGLLRIWTIEKDLDESIGGTDGQFEPADENIWKQHGQEIIDEFIKASDMLPVAEDLGTVPDSSYQILEETGIPGMEVMRWKRDWYLDGKFVEPEHYRLNSISVLSTHDSSTIAGWWKYEAGQVDLESFVREMSMSELLEDEINYLKSKLFKRKVNPAGRVMWRPNLTEEEVDMICSEYSDRVKYQVLDLFRAVYYEREKFSDLIDYKTEDTINVEFVNHSLQNVLEAKSIFSVQMLLDWLYLDDDFLKYNSRWIDRINFPGTVSKKNWTWRTPMSIEELLSSKVNKKIKQLVLNSGR